MSLRACSRCGGTLTEVFRFCPACGESSDEPGWTADDSHGWALDPAWASESKAAISFPVVERPRRSRRPRRLSVPRLALPRIAVRRPRVGARARRLVAAAVEPLRLVVEAALVCAASQRDALRSLVLVRRLEVQRAAVIYTTGCAALSGDIQRVEHARTEVQLLDDLITAAGGRIP